MAMFLKLRVHSASASRAFGIGRASASGNRYSYDSKPQTPTKYSNGGAICEDQKKQMRRLWRKQRKRKKDRAFVEPHVRDIHQSHEISIFVCIEECRGIK